MQKKKRKMILMHLRIKEQKKPLVTTIEIESYKKYNLEGEEEVEEEIKNEEENKQLISESQIVKSNGCCNIF